MPMPRKPRKKCLNCGKECAEPSGIYCSIFCFHHYRRIKRINDGTATHRVLRTHLLKTFGKACTICGIDSWRGQELPIVMDHIDGNSDNNTIEDVRLVCPNCDAQLPTYKSKNIGNGRYYRRKRREEGKSF